MPVKDDDVLVATKCFCGGYVYSEKNSTETCGSKDCNSLASQFGNVANWLITNVEQIASNEQEIILNKIETKIILYMKSVKVGVTQKTIAQETGLAKSTVSRILIKLVEKNLVYKNEFFSEEGFVQKKGKVSSLYSLNS